MTESIVMPKTQFFAEKILLEIDEVFNKTKLNCLFVLVEFLIVF